MIENLELSIGKCMDCPKIKKGLESISIIEELRNEVIEMAFDPEMEEVASVIRDSVSSSNGGAILSAILGIDETSTPEEIADKLRSSQGESYEAMGEHVSFHRDQIEEYVEECSGPLKMRAAKAGRVITVTVCNSPAVLDGGTTNESVHIQRDRIMGD